MKMRSLLIAAAAFSALAGAAAAQSSTSNTIPAKVTFVAPVSVTAGNEMLFGSFTIPTAAGGSIVLTAAGDATPSGGGVVELSSSAPQAGTFTLAALANTNVSLNITTDAVTSGYSLGSYTITGGTGCSSASLTAPFQFTAASCEVSVGATLGLPATATAGQVSVGTVKATLAYP